MKSKFSALYLFLLGNALLFHAFESKTFSQSSLDGTDSSWNTFSNSDSVPMTDFSDFLPPSTPKKEPISSSHSLPSSIEPTFFIENIRIEGLKYSSRESILWLLPSNPHRIYTKDMLKVFWNALIKTGRFKNVKISVEGKCLVIRLTENLFINTIKFVGSRNIAEKELEKILPLRPRQLLGEGDLEKARSTLLEFYKKKGFLYTQILFKVKNTPNNSADITFYLNENKKAHIRKIEFKGNQGIPTSILQSVISSREARWFQFWDPEETHFHDERIQHYDTELLLSHYKDKGYLNVHVTSSAQIHPDHGGVYVTFIIQEGPRYRFGKTQFVYEVPNLKNKKLFSQIPWKSGDFVQEKLIQEFCRYASNRLNQKGYPFVTLQHHYDFHPKNSFVDVRFSVKNESPTYIETIEISGNYKTKENVIRRALGFAEGDPYNAFLVRRGQEQLKSFSFIQSADIFDLPAAHADQRKLLVKLKEKSSGKIAFMAGSSNQNNQKTGWGKLLGNLLGEISYSESNFLGNAWGWMLNSQFGFNVLSASSRLMIPNFLDRPMTAIFALNAGRYRSFFSPKQKLFFQDPSQNDNEFIQKNVGGSFGLRYALANKWSQQLTYSAGYSDASFRDIGGISHYLVDNIKERPDILSSGIAHSLFYEHPIVYRGKNLGGISAILSNKFTGIGGNTAFFSNSLKAMNYWYVFKDWMLRLEGEYGLIQKIGYMRFSQQFFLGGITFPGFEDTGIGPRVFKIDSQSGKIVYTDALGGRQFYTGSLKLYVPLNIFKKLPLKGVFFGQTGSVWSSMFKGDDIVSNDFKNRISAGVGLTCKIPVINADIGFLAGKALKKEPEDALYTWVFLLGREF